MNRLRSALIIALCFLSITATYGKTHFVVADSVSRTALPGASLFDRKGNALGACNARGKTPYIPESSYPITVRYLGYEEKTITDTPSDTIFLQESYTQLPEVVIESRQHKVLHMLGYVREYSTLSTYTDTVFLFREKIVDFVLTPDKKAKFKGWSSPRMLKTKSYYRFTDINGLDSVSDVSDHHFSWSDWMGVNKTAQIPPSLTTIECGSDTLSGKYSPTEIWVRNNDRMTVSVNVLADTASRKWVPYLSGFFHMNLDFETFRLKFNFDNVDGNSVSPADLTGYSCIIESRGRARDMFKFNRVDEPFFVSTYAEVYIIDKEYITMKEAKRWAKLQFADSDIEIIAPREAPQLQPSVCQLVERVENINRDMVRLDFVPDPNLGSGRIGPNPNFSTGRRMLNILKTLTGISRYKHNKNQKKSWRDFRNRQSDKNRKHTSTD